jgi:hypothetical protein
MAVGRGTVHVQGLRELQRALKKLESELAGEIRRELHDLAKPVAVEASRLAAEEITNITPRWAAMKTGATMRGAYIAPAARRGRGTGRPNLAGLLMTRAMLPAAEHRRDDVIRGLEHMIDRLARREGF